MGSYTYFMLMHINHSKLVMINCYIHKKDDC